VDCFWKRCRWISHGCKSTNGDTYQQCISLFLFQKQKVLPWPTLLHSSVAILWGLRLFFFLLIREYITWPALHEKVVEVQSKMNIPFASKLLCWFVYSFFYVALMASCWSRLMQNTSIWGILGYAGLTIQIFGLILESVADMQKNGFKTHHRHSWCNVGVWKFSTHPNYLGEGLFWFGTYLSHGFHSILPSLLATIGLAFIVVVLKGSARSLASKQKEKYGQDPDFHEFHRSHNVFGPKHWWWWLQGLEELSRPKIPRQDHLPNSLTGHGPADGNGKNFTEHE